MGIQDILFPYQTEDVERLVDIPRGLIASEMGTGKTEEFLALCERVNAGRVLVASPKSMVLEWRDRIRLRLGEEASVPVGFESGTYSRNRLTLELFRRRFLIVNHEMLRKTSYVDILKIIPWDVIGLDEAHRFKSPKALQTQGAKALALHTKRLYHITGTPFLNYPDELWSLLNMLYPHHYGSHRDFVGRYCYSIAMNVRGRVIPRIVGPNRRTLPELREKLAQVMVRRTKKEVLPWLPDKLYRDIPLVMETSQQGAYRSMEEEYVVELKSGADLFATSMLARLMRLRQLVLEPATINVAAGSAKTTALVDLISDVKSKIVVFSWFASYLKFLSEFLGSRTHSIIIGDQTAGQRQEARRRFQEDSDCNLLLASIGAGGVGIDLTSAQLAIFTDVFWTPAINSQAEDRLHRIGQKGSVLIIRLIIPETVDEDMHKVLQRKSRAFNQTIAMREAVSSMLKRHAD